MVAELVRAPIQLLRPKIRARCSHSVLGQVIQDSQYKQELIKGSQRAIVTHKLAFEPRDKGTNRIPDEHQAT